MSNYSYNLSDFGGYWSALNNEGVTAQTDFGVGEFPLQITHERNTAGDLYSASSDPGIYLKTAEFFDIAKAGDSVSVTFQLPDVSSDWNLTESSRYTFAMRNADGKKRVECRYNLQTGDITLRTSYTSSFSSALSWDAILSDANMIPIISNEKVVGFTLTGILLDTVSAIWLTPYFSSVSSVSTHTASITYSSYDDMQLTLIPVLAPTIEPLSMWLGWKAGNWVARQRGKKVEEEKTPVAYLYNGVRLPDINAVWTDEVRACFPYACMCKVFGFDATMVFFTSFEMYKNGNQILSKTAGEAASAAHIPGVYDNWEPSNSDEEVKANEVMVDSDADLQLNEPIFWTSHDILNADGTIYLAASEPVPVYE